VEDLWEEDLESKELEGRDSMYPSFTFVLKREGIPATPAHLVDLVGGVNAGLAPTLGELFLLAKATYVKKPEQHEGFERAFFGYFLGIDTNGYESLERAILDSQVFDDWRELNDEVAEDTAVRVFIEDVFGDTRRQAELEDLARSAYQVQAGQVVTIDNPNITPKQGNITKKSFTDLGGLANQHISKMDEPRTQQHKDKKHQGASDDPRSTMVKHGNDPGGYTVPDDHMAEVNDFSDVGDGELEEHLEHLLNIQGERHEGGNSFIGTKGNSAYGHHGFSRYGIRVGGTGRHGTARRVLADQTGRGAFGRGVVIKGYEGATMQQVLEGLKLMDRDGPKSELNVSRTIRKAGNRGYVELKFDRKEIDRMRVALFVDNGGKSMNRHVPVVERLFAKMRSQLRSLDTFYFHNCIYDEVYTDPERTRGISLGEVTSQDTATRVIVVGDASMNPYKEVNNETLGRLRKAFEYSVWMNPVPESEWSHTESIGMIENIFDMFPLTTEGLGRAVDYLTR
jgi:uncharacterized protein